MNHRFNKELQTKGGNYFIICLSFSFAVHSIAGIVFLFSVYSPGFSSEAEYREAVREFDVDMLDTPLEMMGTDGSPAKIEKSEWIEGSASDKGDPAPGDEKINALSGDGTDEDGFLYSFKGDSPPVPIINFDVNYYFPDEARLAKIRSQTVIVFIQVNENGKLQGCRLSSEPAGYGFDQAALKIMRLARFRPGIVGGRPVKMNNLIAIEFKLE